MMCLLGILLFSFSAFAKEQLQLHVEYVEGKVNDPVSKSARVAYIFHENPVFSVSTKGEARRNVQQGGVSFAGEKITDIGRQLSLSELENEPLLQKGKKSFMKIVLE